jgi:hypothetical protein
MTLGEFLLIAAGVAMTIVTATLTLLFAAIWVVNKLKQYWN